MLINLSSSQAHFNVHQTDRLNPLHILIKKLCVNMFGTFNEGVTTDMSRQT